CAAAATVCAYVGCTPATQATPARTARTTVRRLLVRRLCALFSSSFKFGFIVFSFSVIIYLLFLVLCRSSRMRLPRLSNTSRAGPRFLQEACLCFGPLPIADE